MLDLDAIKARLAAATPGPWEEEREGGGYPTGVVYGPDCTVTSCDSEPGTIHQCTNAIFIANAPSDIAALVAEVERLKAELKQARKDRDREALDRQTAGDAWNDMRRQRDTALADLARVTPSAEVRAAWSRVSRYVGHSGAHEDACDAADIVNDWLASLPGSDKEPEGFCACGLRASECDRSRNACTSSVAP